jgi:hypothetical protein
MTNIQRLKYVLLFFEKENHSDEKMFYLMN